MTRRLLAALALTACAGAVFAAPASAQNEDGWICIGSDNRREPGSHYAICIERLPGSGIVH